METRNGVARKTENASGTCHTAFYTFTKDANMHTRKHLYKHTHTHTHTHTHIVWCMCVYIHHFATAGHLFHTILILKRKNLSIKQTHTLLQDMVSLQFILSLLTQELKPVTPSTLKTYRTGQFFSETCYPIILEYISYIVNLYRLSSIWKTAHVIPLHPLHKGDDALDLNDYRPIIKKILVTLVNNQLKTILHGNSVLSDYYSGFREQYRTIVQKETLCSHFH